jgi:hypothetical protein
LITQATGEDSLRQSLKNSHSDHQAELDVLSIVSKHTL